MHRYLVVVVILVAVGACDRSEQDTATAHAQQQLCVQVFQRQRACTDTYIPALVDVRRQLDKPAGIAQADRSEVIAAALEEWKTDSTDEAISATCGRIAAEMPAQQASRCAALSDCGELVGCVMPMVREHLSR